MSLKDDPFSELVDTLLATALFWALLEARVR